MVSLTKPVWVITDDACYQHVRKIDESTFELIEMELSNPDTETFQVYTDTINLDDYKQPEVEEILKCFGYESIRDLLEKCLMDHVSAQQIIAECIFEHYGTFAVEPIFVGNEQECRCKICHYVKGDLCHD